jgi:RNA polymerase sigma-70 factor (ECF subfamily)
MSDTTPTDDTRLTLIERVCALDSASWNEFIMLYSPLLLAYIRDSSRRKNLGFTEQDLEEVKQDVLVKLFQALPVFKLDRENRGRFRTWLWRVVYNAAIDHVRKRQRSQSTGGSDSSMRRRNREVALDAEQLSHMAGEVPAPDEQLIEEHVWDVRRYILHKVQAEMQSSHKWDCFQKHTMEGRPSAEVAAELGMSVAAVNTYSSRVLARIRELSAEYEVEA